MQNNWIRIEEHVLNTTMIYALRLEQRDEKDFVTTYSISATNDGESIQQVFKGRAATVLWADVALKLPARSDSSWLRVGNWVIDLNRLLRVEFQSNDADELRATMCVPVASTKVHEIEMNGVEAAELWENFARNLPPRPHHVAPKLPKHLFERVGSLR